MSRTKPELIKKDLFLKFLGNDEALAWEYAFSSETGRKNSVELDYNNVEYEVLHDSISIDDILSSDKKTITFRIQTPFEFGLKLSSVIRSCLGLSANQFNRWMEAKVIFTPENHSIKKHKIKDGDRILISKERLEGLYTNRITP